MAITELSVHRASARSVYNPLSLLLYDWWVHGVSDRYAWRIPRSELLGLYNTHLSGNHLEIGVGTSLLLHTCEAPRFERLVLGDLNEFTLAKSARRLSRYAPQVATLNVFEPFGIADRFDSVAANYLFHCVPGHGFVEKARAFDNVHEALNDGGVFFGATVVSRGVRKNLFARALMGVLNRYGVFNNDYDDASELEAELRRRFSSVDVRIVGCVARFVARK